MKLLPKKISRPGSARKRSGSAVVEFAIILPFLAMVFMGMFELGRAMMVKSILSDAARNGCRTGIKRDKGNTDIKSDVMTVMTDNGLSSSQFNPNSIGSITITVTDPNGTVLAESLDAPSGSVVSVQVAIPVSSTTWVAPFYLVSGSALESETIVMMKQ